jgi:hypothetical protein
MPLKVSIVVRFLFNLTCALLSGAAVALLTTTVVQHFVSEPTNHPKVALAPLETHWGVERAKIPVQSEPPTEHADRPKTELLGANPGLQQSALTVDVRDPAKPGAADVLPSAAQTQAPSHEAPDSSAQQDKAAAAQPSTQTLGRQQLATLPPAVILSAPPRQAPSAEQAMAPTRTATAPANAGPAASNLPQIGIPAQAAAPSTPPSGTSSLPSEALAATEPAPSAPPRQAAATMMPPSAAQTQALSHQAPDSSAQQDKATAAQPSTQTLGHQQQPNMLAQEILHEKKPVSTGIAAHISIHYRLGSTPARANAELLAMWIAPFGFGAPQILTTGHVVQSPVVRYFFRQDADAASLLVRELQKSDGTWRTEDCTSYRHKPPTGTIEVWPVQVQ